MSLGNKSLIKRLEQVNADVINSFGTLSPSQLTWKQESSAWNIAECLQHIITSNESYFPILDKLSSGYLPGFWEKINPMSRSIGKNMVKTLGKNITKKFKSPALFQPPGIKIPEEVLLRFQTHQILLQEKINSLSSLPADQIIISSPVSPLITLPLSDCLEVIVGHEERHLMQAKTITTSKDFPTS